LANTAAITPPKPLRRHSYAIGHGMFIADRKLALNTPHTPPRCRHADTDVAVADITINLRNKKSHRRRSVTSATATPLPPAGAAAATTGIDIIIAATTKCSIGYVTTQRPLPPRHVRRCRY